MRLSKKVLTVLLAIGMMTSVVGCGGNGNDVPAPPKQEAVKEETKKEQDPKKDTKDMKLTVYCGLTEQHGMAVCKAFEEKTGIKTDMIRMSGGEIYAKLKAEKDAPLASVWYGGPADTFIAAKGDGLLENYIPKESSNIPDKYKDAEGAWTGIYSGYMGFICNTKLIEEKGAVVPKTWDDLLKPEYKGQIVVANPGSSGTGYTMIATLVQKMGEEEAMEYLVKLNDQMKQYPKAGSASSQMAALGETMIGIGFLHDGIAQYIDGYTDLEMVSPEDGSGYEIGATAIIKNGEDIEAAQMFVDFVTSPEGQEIGQTVNSLQFLTNTNAKNPEQLDQLKDAKLIEYDFQWAGENRARLIEAWAEKTGN